MMSGTPTCREGKLRCMADVATDDAGPAGDAFTLRLAIVMLLLKPDGVCHRNVLSPAPVS